MSHLYPQHTNSFDGAFGQALHFLTGGVENGAIYDRNGNFQNIAPQAGGGAIELINGGVKGSLSLVKGLFRAKGATKVVATGNRTVVDLTEETFRQALFKGSENMGGYAIYGTKGMVGSTFNRNIFLIEASKGKSLSGFSSLIKNLEAEALEAGAKKISIYGSSVINKGFLNPNIAKRYGYSFKQSGNGIIVEKILETV